MAKAELPNLLNYTRSIVPSEGVFLTFREGQKEAPLPVTPKTVLGTISNYSGVYKGDKQLDEEKINKDQQAGSNNIQKVDACHLPPGFDTFQLKFSLKFLPNSLHPEACNKTEYVDSLSQFAETYKQKGGYEKLASMYMARVCNGSFLWRNRYGSERTITLYSPMDESLETTTIEVQDYTGASLPDDLKSKLSGWIEKIASALKGDIRFFLMNIQARVKVGEGQEIYPSQEFIDEKGKKLFEVEVRGEASATTAGMHSQKIGNAIRTIDIWYPNADPNRPLAVDPFTVDKRRGLTVRLPNRGGSDFYSYLKNIDSLNEELLSASSVDDIPSEAHYTMAVLIRGGVFSGEKKK